MSAGADQVGASTGWASIEAAPDADSSVRVWVLGGRYREPTLMWASGAYWRLEAQALPGCSRTPVLWHAVSDTSTPPDMPAAGLIEAHEAAVPAGEPAALQEARMILEGIDPGFVTPMECVGSLRNRGGEPNRAAADQIEKAIRTLISAHASRAAI